MVVGPEAKKGNDSYNDIFGFTPPDNTYGDDEPTVFTDPAKKMTLRQALALKKPVGKGQPVVKVLDESTAKKEKAKERARVLAELSDTKSPNPKPPKKKTGKVAPK